MHPTLNALSFDEQYIADYLDDLIAQGLAAEAGDRRGAALARLPGGELEIDEMIARVVEVAQTKIDRLVALRKMIKTPVSDEAGQVVAELGWASQLMDADGETELARKARSLSCLMTSPAENQVPA
ncbi:hypothetical protein [Hansschlegelia sp. KR7-227]|uniref:hypothetical protein n=1 Tax=Hansschlegelia sp. KR7-227 TaxID=3400914 RepID=UPI003C014140